MRTPCYIRLHFIIVYYFKLLSRKNASGGSDINGSLWKRVIAGDEVAPQALMGIFGGGGRRSKQT